MVSCQSGKLGNLEIWKLENCEIGNGLGQLSTPACQNFKVEGLGSPKMDVRKLGSPKLQPLEVDGW